MTARTARSAGWLVVLAIAALVIAGCGSSGNKSSSTSTGTNASNAPAAAGAKDAKVAPLVPAAVKSKGTLIVASDPSYAPNEFVAPDGKTIQGMDADLAKALAGVMGLKASVKNATFDAIIPGLAAKKYDLGMSSFTDTKEREKTVDFVTYFNAGTSFYTKAEGGPNVRSVADLCGHKVAVEKGTTQQDGATAQAKKCKLTVLVFPDQNGANLALASGRADVGMADSPVAAYQVKKSNGQFKLSGQPYGTAPYGIAMPKGTGMTRPVQAALKVLMSNGTYSSIMKKWGIEEGAITNPLINGATA